MPNSQSFQSVKASQNVLTSLVECRVWYCQWRKYKNTQATTSNYTKKNNVPFLIKRKGTDTFILNHSYHFFALTVYFTANANKIVYAYWN